MTRFTDAPKPATSERPKHGQQPGVIAQFVNEGLKPVGAKYQKPGRPTEYISCFFIIQLKQTSSDPEKAGQRLLTRVYFPLSTWDASKKKNGGQDAKLVKMSKDLFGLDYKQVWDAHDQDIASVFVGQPVLVKTEHKGPEPEDGWKSSISALPEGMEVLTVSEDYKPWEIRDNNDGGGQDSGDDIPF